MLLAQLHLTLPVWAHELDLEGRDFVGDEAKVAFAIELSRRNVEARSGGPFGAVVFDGNDRVVSIGVNRVLPQSCSLAHAEIMTRRRGRRMGGVVTHQQAPPLRRLEGRMSRRPGGAGGSRRPGS